jgi:hypothetical protein
MQSDAETSRGWDEQLRSSPQESPRRSVPEFPRAIDGIERFRSIRQTTHQSSEDGMKGQAASFAASGQACVQRINRRCASAAQQR